MRVDFYQLSHDPVEAVLPLIARNTLNSGQRLLVVSADEDQLGKISSGLWGRIADSFLAHGLSGSGDAARQPILLSHAMEPANGARFVAIADGLWRDDASFDRSFYFFDDATLQTARKSWVMLGKREGITRHFWKQHGGKWVEGP